MKQQLTSTKWTLIVIALFVLSTASGISAQSNFDWVRMRGESIPNRAVAGGTEANGKETYICRIGDGGNFVAGKLLNNRCYYNNGRNERSSVNFDVLVGDKHFWTARNINYDRAVIAGSDRDRNYYICRVSESGGVFPGFVDDGRCYFTAGGRGDSSRNFEVLQSEENRYSLLTAAEDGNFQAVQEALRDGQAINQKTSNGKTALMLASEKGHLTIVRELLYERASVDLRDDAGNTALMFAASKGKDEIVHLLMREGANVNTRNNKGETAFIMAAAGGESGIVRDFLRDAEFGRIDRADMEFALFAAASNGFEDVLRVLLDEGTDIESRDADGRTALMLAAASDRPEAVEFLLRNDADINAADLREKTAFDLAVFADADRVMRVLAERGAFLKDAYQVENGILTAALYDKRNALKFLIRYGVSPDARDKSTGDTPLMRSAGAGHDEATEILIKAGAGLNLQNDRGETAVMRAAADSKNNTLKVLIKAGADINMRDNAGRTALGWAILNKHKDTRKTLQKAGARQ